MAVSPDRPSALLFAALLFMILNLCWLPPHARARAIETGESIAMPAPPGYEEVSPGEFSEYIAATAAESAYHLNAFLRLFVKSEEMPLLRQGDFDRLTATITAIWCQPDGALDFYRAKDEKPEENSGRSRAPFNNKGFETLLVDRELLDAVKNAQKEARTHTLTLAAPASEEIQRWLDAAPGSRKRLLLGPVDRRGDVTLFAWLQEKSDAISFSMTGPGPLIVAIALTDVEKRPLGLIFAGQAASAAGVNAFLHKALQLCVDLRPHMAVEKAAPLPILTESFNVLSCVAKVWFAQGRYDNAIDAYKRLVVLQTELGDTCGAFGDTVMLALCHAMQGNVQQMMDLLAPAIRQEENVPSACASRDLFLRNAKELLGRAYAGLGAWPEATALFKDVVRAGKNAADLSGRAFAENRRFYGFLLMNEGTELPESRRQLYAAFAGAVEHHDLGLTALCGLDLVKLGVLEKNIRAASLHSAISAFIVLYCENAATGDCALDSGLREYARNFLHELLADKKIVETPEDFERFWKSPNSPADTPWNRGRDIVDGELELRLYGRFNQVAEALYRAGESDDETAKEKAREEFRAWLEDVDRAFPAEAAQANP